MEIPATEFLKSRHRVGRGPLFLHSEESSSSFKSNTAYYLKPLLDFSYYACTCPYQIEFHPRGPCTLRTNRFQQLLCIWIHLQVMGLLMDYIYLDSSPKKTIKEDPSQVFNLASQSIFHTTQFGFIYFLWMRKSQWLDFCSAVSQLRPNQISAPSRRKCFWTVFPIIALYLGLGVIQCLAAIPHAARNVPFDKMYLKLSPFRIIQYLEIPPINVFWAEFLLSVLFLFNLFFLGLFLNAIAFHVSLISCLAAYKIACDCEEYLRDMSSLQIDQVVRCFMEIRTFFNVMNNATSNPMLLFVFSVIVYFSQSITVLLEASTFMQWLTQALFFGGCMFALYLAGSAAAKLRLFGRVILHLRRRWDYKDSEDNSLPSLFEVYSNPLGLKAHIFLITNGAIVTIISTVFTYSVILIQFISATPQISQPQNASHS